MTRGRWEILVHPIILGSLAGREDLGEFEPFALLPDTVQTNVGPVRPLLCRRWIPDPPRPSWWRRVLARLASSAQPPAGAP